MKTTRLAGNEKPAHWIGDKRKSNNRVLDKSNKVKGSVTAEQWGTVHARVSDLSSVFFISVPCPSMNKSLCISGYWVSFADCFLAPTVIPVRNLPPSIFILVCMVLSIPQPTRDQTDSSFGERKRINVLGRNTDKWQIFIRPPHPRPK